MVHHQEKVLIAMAILSSAECVGSPLPILYRGRFLLLPILPKTNERFGMNQTGSHSPEESIRFSVSIIPCRLMEEYSISNVQIMQVLMSRFKNSSCLEVPSHLEEARLSNGSVDVSSTARWRRSNSPTGYLYPHKRSDMCLVVKRRRRRVQQGILQAFSADSWTATGVALAAFAGALWLIGRRNVLIEVIDAFIHGLFVTRERDRRGNFLFVLLSAFGLVMVSAFTARFMGFLAVLEEPSQVQTLEEVARQVTKVYGDVALPSLFKDVPKNDVVWKLLAKFEPVYEGAVLQKVVREFLGDWPGPALIVSMGQAMPFLNSPLLNDAATGTSFAYPVPQCLLSPAYISYPTRPHWPQRHLLDVQLGKLAQAGILTKLDSDMWVKFRALGLVHRGPALSTSSSSVPTPEEPRPLQLSALHEPAAVLCVGALAAAMTFLVEMALRMRACRLLVEKSRLFLRLRPAEPPRWAVRAY